MSLREEIADEGIAFRRLHLLVSKGYKPAWVAKPGWNADQGSIELEHPAWDFKNGRLTLYPSGLILSVSTDDIFRPEDQAKFEAFLKKVPKPTLADRTRDFRG